MHAGWCSDDEIKSLAGLLLWPLRMCLTEKDIKTKSSANQK
jgi:hypothetical protein